MIYGVRVNVHCRYDHWEFFFYTDYNENSSKERSNSHEMSYKSQILHQIPMAINVLNEINPLQSEFLSVGKKEKKPRLFVYLRKM